MADPITSIPGISSGIDWTSVVDQIITAQKKPATRLQASIDANSKKKDALEQVRQAMATLQTASDGLRNGKALDAFTITATGTDATGRTVLAATVGTGAVAGTSQVSVTSLAAAQKTVAATGWTGTRTLPADGTLVVGGANVALKAGDTIATIRDRINALSGTSGVQASILSVDGTGNDQRLVLSGMKSGSANAFTVSDASSGALVASLGLTGPNTVDAADAKLTIDGGATITRPTNTVTDALPGVTLTLSAKGSSTVLVDRQPTAGVTAMQAFVDAYNGVQALVKQQSVAGSPLQNDALLRTVRGALSGMTLTPAARVDDSGVPTAVVSDMTSLGRLGVSVNKDGTLSLDTAAFNAVYPSRMNDVRAVLSDRMSTFFHYADSFTGTFTGQIDKRETAMQAQDASSQSRLDDLNARLDKKRTALLAQYAKFEATLGSLKSVGDSLTAQFTALNNTGTSSS